MGRYTDTTRPDFIIFSYAQATHRVWLDKLDYICDQNYNRENQPPGPGSPVLFPN